MKYKKELIITLIITMLVLFLRFINVLQIENGLGKPIIIIILIIVLSFGSIIIQKHIDNNYQNNNINYDNLDILKYICAVLIVILHMRPFLNFSNQLDLVFNNIITRVCVPTFFVITGYFVYKKEKKNPDYIKDYIKKIIPLYLIWSLIYIPIIIIKIIQYLPTINLYITNINISPILLILLFVILLPVIILIALSYTGIYYHLWYFPALILSLYVLDKWKRKFPIKYLLIISFVLLLFGATETYYGVLPFSIKRLTSFYYKVFFTTRNFLFFGLFYVVLGYHMGSKEKIYSKYCFEKLIISVFFLVFEAILLHDTKRLNSNILLSCIPLIYYLFISSIFINNNIKYKFPFRNLSKYYYLVHPMIITILTFLSIIIPNMNPYIKIVIVLSITHFISVLIIIFKKKHQNLII